MGLFCFSAVSANAQAIELPLDADNCAIHRVPNGENPSNCPDISTLGTKRGVVLRLNPAGTIPTPEAKTQNNIIRIATKSKPTAPRRKLDRRAAPTSDSYFIQFTFDSIQLEPSFITHLDQLAHVLLSPEVAGSCLKVVGHTDTIGKTRYNRDLSQKRAVAVALYLSKRHEIPPTRIAMKAKGEAQPLPDIAGGDPRNRRVEFTTKASEHGC